MTDLLQLAQGSPEWQKVRDKALADFAFFGSVVLGYGELIPMQPDVHQAYCAFVARQTGCPEIDGAPVLLGMMPRDVGKTSIGTKALPLWGLCHDQNTSTLIVNEKLETAKKFLYSIKQHLTTNDLLRHLFPELRPDDAKWNEGEINVIRSTSRQEPSVFVTGVGGSVTGNHPDRIVVDDPISEDARNNAKVGNRSIMEQVNQWLHTLPLLLNKNAKPRPSILITGTHWYHDDTYDHAVEFFGGGQPVRTFLIRVRLPGRVQQIPVQVIGDIAVFRRGIIENGHSIFPVKYPDEMLAKMQVADPELFAANMMNQPSNELTATFKESWHRHYDWLDADTVTYTATDGRVRTDATRDLDCVMLIDPGGFGRKRAVGGGRARPAIVVTGTTSDDLHLLLEAWSEPTTYAEAITEAVQFCRLYPIRKVGCEIAGQQAAFIAELRRQLREAGLTVGIEEIPTGNQDKDLRILGLESYFQNGRILSGKGPKFAEYRDQYKKFPKSGRKDLLDALSNGPLVWRKRRQGGPGYAERRKQELSLLYQRMGIRRPA